MSARRFTDRQRMGRVERERAREQRKAEKRLAKQRNSDNPPKENSNGTDRQLHDPRES
jgi:hypothetical protein